MKTNKFMTSSLPGVSGKDVEARIQCHPSKEDLLNVVLEWDFRDLLPPQLKEEEVTCEVFFSGRGDNESTKLPFSKEKTMKLELIEVLVFEQPVDLVVWIEGKPAIEVQIRDIHQLRTLNQDIDLVLAYEESGIGETPRRQCKADLSAYPSDRREWREPPECPHAS